MCDALSADTEAAAAAKTQPKKKRRESGMLKAVKAELAAERAEAAKASAAVPNSAGRLPADASAAGSAKKGKAAKAPATNGTLQQPIATAADAKLKKRKKAATGAAAAQAAAGGKPHKKHKQGAADAQPAVDAALDAQLLASGTPLKAVKKAALAAVSGRPAKGVDTQQQKQAALKRKMLKMKATAKPK